MAVTSLAVMSFDGVQLLLPQQGVATIEVVKSIRDEDGIPGSIGILKSSGREWPVFALRSDFKTLSDCPVSYKFCVGINLDNQEAFSIACEEVSTLSVENPSDFIPVQTSMLIPGCPFESLLMKSDKMMLVSSVETMQQFLSQEAGEA